MRKYRFLDERKFRFLCEGLTLDAKDMEVLDTALDGLDKNNRLTSKILEHNQRNGFGPPPKFPGPTAIIVLEKRARRDTGQTLSTAAVVEDKDRPGGSPGLHILLHSPTLDIPQRVEIPLRLVLKGLPSFESLYMVYLHVLKMSDGQNLVYYGITKRGWMKRFMEHMARSVRDDSPLLFHRSLREGILERLRQRGMEQTLPAGVASPSPHGAMIGNHHVLCGAGMTEEQALETEEYLVDKYSFGKAGGLNMIPGGKAGILHLHKLKIIQAGQRPVLDGDRDALLETYVRANPRKGMANLRIAEHWQNPDYAARVICGPDGRFDLEDIRRIRDSSAAGATATDIQKKLDVEDKRRIQRVIDGKTYTRIR